MAKKIGYTSSASWNVDGTMLVQETVTNGAQRSAESNVCVEDSAAGTQTQDLLVSHGHKRGKSEVRYLFRQKHNKNGDRIVYCNFSTTSCKNMQGKGTLGNYYNRNHQLGQGLQITYSITGRIVELELFSGEIDEHITK